MRILLALVLCLSFAPLSRAAIGETLAELRQRYGPPLDAEGKPDAPTSRWTFTDRRYLIVVTLRNNRSIAEEFTRRDRRDFTLREVRELLDDNEAPGAGWREVSARQWRQGDRVASWFDGTVAMRGE